MVSAEKRERWTKTLHYGPGPEVSIATEDLRELLAVVTAAERLAAALALVLYDAHPVFGSTSKWRGGVGGQAISPHCSITQGTPPGDEWAEHDLPSRPLREFIAEHPFDLDAAKQALKQELLR